MRKFGVNIAALLPWSFGPGPIDRSLEIIVRAGLDGFQLLPMRGWNHSVLRELPPHYVLSFEGPWNTGSVWQALRQFLGRGQEHDPTWIDLALFGGPEICHQRLRWFRQYFLNALFITHEPEDGAVLETKSQSGFSQEAFAAHPEGIVWDMKWVWCPETAAEQPLAPDWRVFLEQLPVGQIRMIHAKLETKYPGGMSERDSMLALLEEKTRETQVPVVIEDKPLLGRKCRSMRETIDWLKRQREVLGRYFS